MPLVTSLKKAEQVEIETKSGEKILVKVVQIQKNRTRLCFIADKSISICRQANPDEKARPDNWGNK